MFASSEDAVLRAEQSLASAGITDGAILPGVYEGSGEQLVGLVGHGKVVRKVDFETSIRIELAANGRFFYTETLDRKTQKMTGDYVLTTAGVDFTPEGKKPFSIRVVKGVFQCGIGLGDTLSLKRVQ
jgi:hypothetical protein